jgi:hypothetical protein
MPSRRPDPALKPALRAAVHAVARALEALPVPGMLIGGIAVITRGAPRLTRDVDATIAGGTLDPADLIDRLRAHQVVPPYRGCRGIRRSAPGTSAAS